MNDPGMLFFLSWLISLILQDPQSESPRQYTINVTQQQKEFILKLKHFLQRVSPNRSLVILSSPSESESEGLSRITLRMVPQQSQSIAGLFKDPDESSTPPPVAETYVLPFSGVYDVYNDTRDSTREFVRWVLSKMNEEPANFLCVNVKTAGSKKKRKEKGKEAQPQRRLTLKELVRFSEKIGKHALAEQPKTAAKPKKASNTTAGCNAAQPKEPLVPDWVLAKLATLIFRRRAALIAVTGLGEIYGKTKSYFEKYNRANQRLEKALANLGGDELWLEAALTGLRDFIVAEPYFDRFLVGDGDNWAPAAVQLELSKADYISYLAKVWKDESDAKYVTPAARKERKSVTEDTKKELPLSAYELVYELPPKGEDPLNQPPPEIEIGVLAFLKETGAVFNYIVDLWDVANQDYMPSTHDVSEDFLTTMLTTSGLTNEALGLIEHLSKTFESNFPRLKSYEDIVKVLADTKDEDLRPGCRRAVSFAWKGYLYAATYRNWKNEQYQVNPYLKNIEKAAFILNAKCNPIPTVINPSTYYPNFSIANVGFSKRFPDVMSSWGDKNEFSFTFIVETMIWQHVVNKCTKKLSISEDADQLASVRQDLNWLYDEYMYVFAESFGEKTENIEHQPFLYGPTMEGFFTDVRGFCQCHGHWLKYNDTRLWDTMEHTTEEWGKRCNRRIYKPLHDRIQVYQRRLPQPLGEECQIPGAEGVLEEEQHKVSQEILPSVNWAITRDPSLHGDGVICQEDRLEKVDADEPQEDLHHDRSDFPVSDILSEFDEDSCGEPNFDTTRENVGRAIQHEAGLEEFQPLEGDTSRGPFRDRNDMYEVFESNVASVKNDDNPIPGEGLLLDHPESQQVSEAASEPASELSTENGLQHKQVVIEPVPIFHSTLQPPVLLEASGPGNPIPNSPTAGPIENSSPAYNSWQLHTTSGTSLQQPVTDRHDCHSFSQCDANQTLNVPSPGPEIPMHLYHGQQLESSPVVIRGPGQIHLEEFAYNPDCHCTECAKYSIQTIPNLCGQSFPQQLSGSVDAQTQSRGEMASQQPEHQSQPQAPSVSTLLSPQYRVIWVWPEPPAGELVATDAREYKGPWSRIMFGEQSFWLPWRPGLPLVTQMQPILYERITSEEQVLEEPGEKQTPSVIGEIIESSSGCNEILDEQYPEKVSAAGVMIGGGSTEALERPPVDMEAKGTAKEDIAGTKTTYTNATNFEMELMPKLEDCQVGDEAESDSTKVRPDIESDMPCNPHQDSSMNRADTAVWPNNTTTQTISAALANVKEVEKSRNRAIAINIETAAEPHEMQIAFADSDTVNAEQEATEAVTTIVTLANNLGKDPDSSPSEILSLNQGDTQPTSPVAENFESNPESSSPYGPPDRDVEVDIGGDFASDISGDTTIADDVNELFELIDPTLAERQKNEDYRRCLDILCRKWNAWTSSNTLSESMCKSYYFGMRLYRDAGFIQAFIHLLNYGFHHDIDKLRLSTFRQHCISGLHSPTALGLLELKYFPFEFPSPVMDKNDLVKNYIACLGKRAKDLVSPLCMKWINKLYDIDLESGKNVPEPRDEWLYDIEKSSPMFQSYKNGFRVTEETKKEAQRHYTLNILSKAVKGEPGYTRYPSPVNSTARTCIQMLERRRALLSAEQGLPYVPYALKGVREHDQMLESKSWMLRAPKMAAKPLNLYSHYNPSFEFPDPLKSHDTQPNINLDLFKMHEVIQNYFRRLITEESIMAPIRAAFEETVFEGKLFEEDWQLPCLTLYIMMYIDIIGQNNGNETEEVKSFKEALGRITSDELGQLWPEDVKFPSMKHLLGFPQFKAASDASKNENMPASSEAELGENKQASPGSVRNEEGKACLEGVTVEKENPLLHIEGSVGLIAPDVPKTQKKDKKMELKPGGIEVGKGCNMNAAGKSDTGKELEQSCHAAELITAGKSPLELDLDIEIPESAPETYLAEQLFLVGDLKQEEQTLEQPCHAVKITEAATPPPELDTDVDAPDPAPETCLVGQLFQSADSKEEEQPLTIASKNAKEDLHSPPLITTTNQHCGSGKVEERLKELRWEERMRRLGRKTWAELVEEDEEQEGGKESEREKDKHEKMASRQGLKENNQIGKSSGKASAPGSQTRRNYRI